MIFPGRFAGKAVVVTGAAQGIGRTVARRIAGEGSKLALVDRAPLVEEVRHEAEAADAEAIAVIADLETFAGAIAAINGAQEHFDHIDILINNVGGTIWAKPYAEYGEAEIVAEIRRSMPTTHEEPNAAAQLSLEVMRKTRSSSPPLRCRTRLLPGPSPRSSTPSGRVQPACRSRAPRTTSATGMCGSSCTARRAFSTTRNGTTGSRSMPPTWSSGCLPGTTTISSSPTRRRKFR